MGDKPEKTYRYKNLKLVAWKEGKRPSVLLEKGWKPKGQDAWTNDRIKTYPTDLYVWGKLIEAYLTANPDVLKRAKEDFDKSKLEE